MTRHTTRLWQEIIGLKPWDSFCLTQRASQDFCLEERWGISRPISVPDDSWLLTFSVANKRRKDVEEFAPGQVFFKRLESWSRRVLKRFFRSPPTQFRLCDHRPCKDETRHLLLGPFFVLRVRLPRKSWWTLTSSEEVCEELTCMYARVA